jgi:hypothetical protein
MPTEQQPEAAVHNEKTPEIELEEDPVSYIPRYPSEHKDDIKDDLVGIETDPGSLEGGDVDDLEESIRLVPKIVRELVSMDDDPSLPTITFRYKYLFHSFLPICLTSGFNSFHIGSTKRLLYNHVLPFSISSLLPPFPV